MLLEILIFLFFNLQDIWDIVIDFWDIFWAYILPLPQPLPPPPPPPPVIFGPQSEPNYCQFGLAEAVTEGLWATGQRDSGVGNDTANYKILTYGGYFYNKIERTPFVPSGPKPSYRRARAK